MIRGLTLYEPYASFMKLLMKTLETRGWRPRELPVTVAIHAGLTKVKPEQVAELCAKAGVPPFPADYVWPYGKIVASGTLSKCPKTEEVTVLTPQERALGDYSTGRRAWAFTDFWVLPEPVACRGGRGLWEVPAEVEKEILAQRVRLSATRPSSRGNGHAAPAEPEIAPPDPKALTADAISWAKECGLRDEVHADAPTRIDYPQRGHGYVVVVHERAGRGQMGVARFTADGRRGMWTLDGKGVQA